MALCKYGPEGDCGRKTVVRDMCMTHYRRWRAWTPLDSPVRQVPAIRRRAGRRLYPGLPIRPQAARRAAFASDFAPCGVWAFAKPSGAFMPYPR